MNVHSFALSSGQFHLVWVLFIIKSSGKEINFNIFALKAFVVVPPTVLSDCSVGLCQQRLKGNLDLVFGNAQSW